MRRTITSAGVCVMLAMGASVAQAQVGRNFDPADWQYGARYVADGEVPIWNPVMQKDHERRAGDRRHDSRHRPPNLLRHGRGRLRLPLDRDAA